MLPTAVVCNCMPLSGSYNCCCCICIRIRILPLPYCCLNMLFIISLLNGFEFSFIFFLSQPRKSHFFKWKITFAALWCGNSMKSHEGTHTHTQTQRLHYSWLSSCGLLFVCVNHTSTHKLLQHSHIATPFCLWRSSAVDFFVFSVYFTYSTHFFFFGFVCP